MILFSPIQEANRSSKRENSLLRKREPVVPDRSGVSQAARITDGLAAFFSLLIHSVSKQALAGKRRRDGFTMVELLTVIAVIAVLATLLLSAIGTAKKKGRQVRCISNLHQISLALNMYLDDHEKRPPAFDPLVQQRYLPAPAVILCPEDKTGNWGGWVNGSGPALATDAVMEDLSFSMIMESTPVDAATEMAEPLPFSYLHPLGWSNEAWNRLQSAGGSAGMATCQWHGLGRPNPDGPSLLDFQGVVLRGQRDGAVVRRKIFWETAVNKASDAAGIAPPSLAPPLEPPGFAARMSQNQTQDTWKLLSDEPQP